MTDDIDTGTWTILAVAGLFAVIGTWLVRTAARRFGIVNQPNAIVPQHTKPIAYLGGVGVVIGVVLTCGLLAFLSWINFQGIGGQDGWNGAVPIAIALPAVLYLALGLADDLAALTVPVKFLAQGLIALIAVAGGLIAPLTGQFWIDAVLSWFWIAAVVNAFNLTDVCDGLLGGLSAVMFFWLAFTGIDTAPLAVAVTGACLGFLVFNRPRATIFLGDAGSHLLGFLAAAMTVHLFLAKPQFPIQSVVQSFLLLSVPLFEMIFLTVVRHRKGLPWWKGSPDHFSLRLQAAGLTALQTDAIAWIVAFASGFVAISFVELDAIGQTVMVAVVGIGFLIAAGILWDFEVEPKVPTPMPSLEQS